jgi:hypothetical protein
MVHHKLEEILQRYLFKSDLKEIGTEGNLSIVEFQQQINPANAKRVVLSFEFRHQPWDLGGIAASER